jgi:hypothetical protein
LKPFEKKVRNVTRNVNRNDRGDRQPLERWLRSEHEGDDAAADAALVQLFTALPKTAPDEDFVERTVMAMMRQHARRRRLVAAAWAASILVALAVGATVYAAVPYAAEWAIKSIAFGAGHGVPWLIAYSTVALDWWWTTGRIGVALASVIATPARATVLVGAELVGILAFFALQRLVRTERFGDA